MVIMWIFLCKYKINFNLLYLNNHKPLLYTEKQWKQSCIYSRIKYL